MQFSVYNEMISVQNHIKHIVKIIKHIKMILWFSNFMNIRINVKNFLIMDMILHLLAVSSMLYHEDLQKIQALFINDQTIKY